MTDMFSENESLTSSTHCMDIVALTTASIRRAIQNCVNCEQVSMDDICRILSDVVKPDHDIANILNSRPPPCSQINAPSAFPHRPDPFLRLMVQPFESLLQGDPPLFPRRYLPNYFKVLECAGCDWIDNVRQICIVIHSGLSPTHGIYVDWADYYADPGVRRIQTHSLRNLITYLDRPIGRRLWQGAMQAPIRDGTSPSQEQAQHVWDALHETWRALEEEAQNRAAADFNRNAARLFDRNYVTKNVLQEAPAPRQSPPSSDGPKASSQQDVAQRVKR